MAADWYLARGGQERVGPLTSQQLKQMAANGQVSGNDLVWKEGMPNWVPASQIKGLVGGSGSTQAFAPAATQAQAQAQAAADYPEVTEAEEPAAPAHYQEEDRGPRREGGEPWFYGSLERFAKIFMWVGFALVLLFFINYIMAAIAAFQLSVLAGTILLMLSLIGSAFMTVFILVWTALMLLVVDAGRNLRSINRKTGKT
jgi:hypothetical protein